MCLAFALYWARLRGVPVFARLWPGRISFTTGAVQSAILATAGLRVYFDVTMG